MPVPLPHRRSVLSMLSSLRSVVALVEGERSNDDRQDGEVSHTLVAIHQQGSQQEVMHEKQHKKQDKLTPHEKHFRPVEHELWVAHRAHIQTQQRGCK